MTLRAVNYSIGFFKYVNKKMKKLLIIVFFYSSFTFANPVDDAINKLCKQHNINPDVIRILIDTESAFKPHVVSNAGAIGLMQLMPATAKRFGVSNPYDPIQNVEGGIKYFSFLLKRYGYIKLALAAYNAGENAVDKYRGIPPYKETINYVKKISREFERKTGRVFSNPEMFIVVR